MFEDALAEYHHLGDERWAKARTSAAVGVYSWHGDLSAAPKRRRQCPLVSCFLCRLSATHVCLLLPQISSLLPFKSVDAVRRRYTLLEVSTTPTFQVLVLRTAPQRVASTQRRTTCGT